jgi:hypothetical protein
MANQMIALQARGPQLPDPGRQTAQYANMMNMARQSEVAQRQASLAQQTMDINQAEEGRKKELQPSAVTKAQSEAGSARLEYVMDFYTTSEIALSNAYNPQQAAALGSRIKEMFPEPALHAKIDETIAELGSDPATFEVNRKRLLNRTMEAKDQLARQIKTQTTGTQQREISMPTYGGGADDVATEVPGSRLNVAEGMQYIKDEYNNIHAVPKTTGGGFDTPAPSTGAPGGGRGGNTADVVYGFGKYGSPSKPLSTLSISDVQDFQRNTLIPNTRGKVGAGPDKGTGAVGTYQIVYETLKDYAPKVFGANWRNQIFTADAQEQLAKAIYEDVKGGNLKDTWAGLPNNRPGEYANVPFEQIRDTIIQVESVGSSQGSGGANQGSGSGARAPTGPRVVIKGTKASNEARNAKDAAVAKYNSTIATAQRLLNNPDLDSILGNIQGNIPDAVLSLLSQDAANALSDYNNLLTIAGFQELQDMRDAAKTGGALGQVSDRENIMLQQSAFASSRTQSGEKFRTALKDYIAKKEASRQRVLRAYEQDFGTPTGGTKTKPQKPKTPKPKTPVNTGWGKAKQVGK